MVNYKTLNTFTAIGSFINSVFFILAPVFSLTLMGRTAAPIGLMNTRLAGACALGFCVVTWKTRNTNDPEIQKIIALGNLIMLGVLVFVDLHGILTGAINFVGYAFLAADSFLSVGYANFLIKMHGIKA